jgi:RNA polymerase sigma-70 factor (ECF subfamily)
MLRDFAAAEDVVQEAFLSVWRQAESFDPGRSAARTWILSIVHHRAVDRFRRVTAREVPGALLDLMPEKADEAVNVEEQAHVSLESGRVQDALVALPPEQKQAIELAYFEGLSASEIAQRLEVPLGTIKGRIRIGLQKLKATLDYVNAQEATHDSR